MRIITPPTSAWPSTPLVYGYGTYGYNSSGISGSLPAVSPPIGLGKAAGGGAVRESHVISPSTMIASGDAQIVSADPAMSGVGTSDLTWVWGWYYAYGVVDPKWSARPPLVMSRKRHQDRWNITFCDGHTELLKPGKLFNYKSDEIMRLWNRDHQPHREWLNPDFP